MSDFQAKMHQIRFRLGLHPRPCWEVYSALPVPIAVFKGLTCKAGEGKRGEGKGEETRGEGTSPDVFPLALASLLHNCRGGSPSHPSPPFSFLTLPPLGGRARAGNSYERMTLV